MIPNGVDISITGSVEKIICAYLTGLFFLSFFCFSFDFLSFLYVLLVKVQYLTCSTSYGVKKTLITNNRLLHLLMGTIKHPKSIGKIPFA